ncbi:hypothetical protein [Actinopolymorpha rutila]|uniref:Uncharacterized protein n=1 Tax=Actinopolymorpha rutila TaxID=446787 RepID=A0A852ZPJ5_9ACTN|nr:hypothetical protein [Actinopolymorpha rutila]NYH93462.1 hypothetical protein [Actinopolymorpha rutila]
MDALVVVPDGALASFWPERTWLPPLDQLGESVAYKHWPFPPHSGVTQVLLDDGRHLDIMVIEEQSVNDRLKLLADLRPVVNNESLAHIANEILFDAMGAVGRSARGERLLATQLALKLMDHCLAAALAVRELETGTCVHPGPTVQDSLADLLPAVPASPRPADVLALVAAAMDCFERIVGRTDHAPPFPRVAIDRLIARAAGQT